MVYSSNFLGLIWKLAIQSDNPPAFQNISHVHQLVMQTVTAYNSSKSFPPSARFRHWGLWHHLQVLVIILGGREEFQDMQLSHIHLELCLGFGRRLKAREGEGNTSK
jgi:hypothetical protein